MCGVIGVMMDSELHSAALCGSAGFSSEHMKLMKKRFEEKGGGGGTHGKPCRQEKGLQKDCV